MPQTADQLRAAILNLPCKPPALTASAEVWAYQYGHRDARHAAAELVSAVPLVAEAPREMGDKLTRAVQALSVQTGEPAATIADWLCEGALAQLILNATAPKAALPASLAPMPDLSDEQIADLSLQFVEMEPLSDFDYVGFARAAIALGTSPSGTRVQRIEMTDAQRRMLTTTATHIPGASASPQQPEQKTGSFHLAAPLESAVQGLDAAAGVGVADAPQEFFCNKCGYFGPVEVFHERPNGSGKCDYMAAPMKASRCKVPPPGWSCSRDPGHEGPCAARPDGVSLIEDQTK